MAYRVAPGRSMSINGRTVLEGELVILDTETAQQLVAIGALVADEKPGKDDQKKERTR